jgi:hypothetical protein
MLGATRSAMVRTQEEVFDRHAHALGEGNLDGLIRVQTACCALQHNR